MSVPEGRTIILSQYYFMSLRDRKYNLHKIRGQREFGRGDHVQLTADNAMLFLCFFGGGKKEVICANSSQNIWCLCISGMTADILLHLTFVCCYSNTSS